MAMTATISCSPSAVQINQQVTATITVSNSGSSAVTVQGIRLHAIYHGATEPNPAAVGYGTANLSAGATTSVAASGSTVFPVNLVFFAPSTGVDSTGSGTYDVTAYIQSSDGSYFSPTVTQVKVNNIPLPASVTL